MAANTRQGSTESIRRPAFLAVLAALLTAIFGSTGVWIVSVSLEKTPDLNYYVGPQAVGRDPNGDVVCGFVEFCNGGDSRAKNWTASILFPEGTLRWYAISPGGSPPSVSLSVKGKRPLLAMKADLGGIRLNGGDTFIVFYSIAREGKVDVTFECDGSKGVAQSPEKPEGFAWYWLVLSGLLALILVGVVKGLYATIVRALSRHMQRVASEATHQELLQGSATEEEEEEEGEEAPANDDATLL